MKNRIIIFVCYMKLKNIKSEINPIIRLNYCTRFI